MFRLTIALMALALATSGCSSAGAESGVPPTTSVPVVSSTSAAVLPTTTTLPTTTLVAESAYATQIAQWQESNDVVGAVVLVVDGSGDSDLTAIGYSDRQSNREMTETDVFRIGSITKVYTAALVMKLVDLGSLSLLDSASAYVPKLPAEITIGQLLSHTAGLRDVDVAAGIFEAIESGGLPEQSRDAIDDALERGLAFEPGATQSYSSVGYLALERVIEGVTDIAWDEALRELVLPNGAATRLEDDATSLPTPYERLGPASPAISLASLPTSGFARGAGAAGGLVSSATDIADFVRALFAAEIVTTESLAQMMDVAAPRESYGFGLAYYDIGDSAVFGHNGRTIGFASSVRHDPARGVTVVVLSNDGSAPTDELSNELILAAVSDR